MGGGSAPREITETDGIGLTLRANDDRAGSGKFEKDHPVGIPVSGMFIVSCYRATKMSGTSGARIERLGSSGKYAEIQRANMENIRLCKLDAIPTAICVN